MTWSNPETLGGGDDEVGFGPARPPGRRGRRWPLILAGAVVIVAAAALGLRPAPRRDRSRPRTAVAVTERQATACSACGAGWELLGYGPRRAVRVQLARGRVTEDRCSRRWTVTARSRL